MPKWGSTITGYFLLFGVPVLHMLRTNMRNDPTQAIPALVPTPDPIPARPVRLFTEQHLRASSGAVSKCRWPSCPVPNNP